MYGGKYAEWIEVDGRKVKNREGIHVERIELCGRKVEEQVRNSSFIKKHVEGMKRSTRSEKGNACGENRKRREESRRAVEK